MADAAPQGTQPSNTPAAAPQPGTPEYNAAMIAAASAAGATVNGQPVSPSAAPEAPKRPDNVPEKFWDATTGQVNTEALLKSYRDLEASRTQPATQPANQQATQQAPVVTDGKPDMGALTAEFAANGALSDASYAALEAANIPRVMVDSYIQGQQALQATRDAKGFDAAGGKEAFEQMSAWAASALSPAEVSALNRALASDEGSMLLAVAGLKAKYEASNGKEPALLGGNSSNGGVTPFGSNAEMTAAMRDPRYAKDAAYRQSVHARVAGMQIGVTTRGSV
jgi:hypothetical protein